MKISELLSTPTESLFCPFCNVKMGRRSQNIIYCRNDEADEITHNNIILNLNGHFDEPTSEYEQLCFSIHYNHNYINYNYFLKSKSTELTIGLFTNKTSFPFLLDLDLNTVTYESLYNLIVFA